MPRDLPAIKYEPDGYSLSGTTVVGRQAAGHAFLRAAVQACDGGALVACTPHQRSAQSFAEAVNALDPRVKAHWLPSNRLTDLASIGTLYVPDPSLAEAARTRLRVGPQAYALCGVTHTLSSHWAMDAIKHMVSAPLMPWDALICTSTAAKQVVERIWAQERDYIQWRMGTHAAPPMPQLPVIPLGVHARDFNRPPQTRQAAREGLGIAPDEVVMLFMGRLSFHSKAHPHAMYVALQAAAAQTGQAITLVQCGVFGSELAESAFKEGAAQFCPDVRTIFIEGQDAQRRPWAWAAADVFISLADNVQETFGLTPVEAMAAGLPVVVSDWNGYKDTVRDGVDGFRIPTWMPQAGAADGWASSLETAAMDFDMYSGLSGQAIALDMQMLVERLVQLIEQPDLRQRLGEQGRAHAAAHFDWAEVFKQYISLWNEQTAMRKDAAGSGADKLRLSVAPRFDPARQDPFRLFAGYGTHEVSPQFIMHWNPTHSVDDVLRTLRTPLFSFAMPSGAEQMRRLTDALARLQAEPLSIQAWAQACNAPVADMVLLACQLSKAGALTLRSSQA
ncbi:MAG: glycosyltransferase family 4 protein [Aquabacterium sp.]|uniref:glycosyltransferase family 4 protein n=1 Tax=Aquabacterium sp. TaxID=1872578 RepID=UPI0025C59BE8|nr:glycosyltransferase family 4 protein [Aquabacterium sp.]MBI5926827.1 glycosyltransferase family 4 protein [Aquabacterium sp.]